MEFFFDDAALDGQGSDFDDAIAVSRRKAGRFDIKDDES
jgi:hypothetical protein